MSKQVSPLQFTSDVITCLENLKSKRQEIQNLIDQEEVEKGKLQSEIEDSMNKLTILMSSLSKKVEARAECDRSMNESENALRRLLEKSKAAINNMKKETLNSTKEDIMKPATQSPSLIDVSHTQINSEMHRLCTGKTDAFLVVPCYKSAANGL